MVGIGIMNFYLPIATLFRVIGLKKHDHVYATDFVHRNMGRPSIDSWGLSNPRYHRPFQLHHLAHFRGGANEFNNYSPQTSTSWKIRPSSAKPKGTSTDVSRAKTKKQIQKAFSTRRRRNKFITRVYSILSVQLLFVTAVTAAFRSNRILNHFIATHGSYVFWVSFSVSIITWNIACASPTARRSPKTKWWLLRFFTAAEAALIGTICFSYELPIVLSAFMSTALATGAITLYTLWNKKYDISQWGTAIGLIGLIFLAYRIIHLFSYWGILPPDFLPYNQSIVSFLGAALFSLYLAYDTRLIVSGEHNKYEMNEQDDVFGAMNLYMDLSGLFLHLLALLEEEEEKKSKEEKSKKEKSDSDHDQ